MGRKTHKPTPEAKALSLYLMAHKAKDPNFKEQLKRINRLWDLVRANEISKNDYLDEVERMLLEHGGYAAVVEKTVKYYLDKTGEWTLKGDDKYCLDAQKIVYDLSKKE